MLAFAAVLLGTLVGLERRASGGILAPILTHLTWSLTMLRSACCRLIFAAAQGRCRPRSGSAVAAALLQRPPHRLGVRHRLAGHDLADRLRR